MLGKCLNINLTVFFVYEFLSSYRQVIKSGEKKKKNKKKTTRHIPNQDPITLRISYPWAWW